MPSKRAAPVPFTPPTWLVTYMRGGGLGGSGSLEHGSSGVLGGLGGDAAPGGFCKGKSVSGAPRALPQPAGRGVFRQGVEGLRLGLSLSHFLLLWVSPLPPLIPPPQPARPSCRSPRGTGSLSGNICGERTKLAGAAGDRGLRGARACFPLAETPAWGEGRSAGVRPEHRLTPASPPRAHVQPLDSAALRPASRPAGRTAPPPRACSSGPPRPDPTPPRAGPAGPTRARGSRRAPSARTARRRWPRHAPRPLPPRPPWVSPGPACAAGRGVARWGTASGARGAGASCHRRQWSPGERRPPPHRRGAAPAGPRPAPAHWLRAPGAASGRSRRRPPSVLCLSLPARSLAIPPPRLCLPPAPRSQPALARPPRNRPPRPLVGNGRRRRGADGIPRAGMSPAYGRPTRHSPRGPSGTGPGLPLPRFTRWPL